MSTSLLQGIPHFCFSDHSIVRAFGVDDLTLIDDDLKLDKEHIRDLMCDLSYMCWTVTEIKEGKPSHLMNEGLRAEIELGYRKQLRRFGW